MKILLLLLISLQGLFSGNAPFSYIPDVGHDQPALSSNLYQTAKSDTSQQCSGIAKSTGEQCKLRTTNTNGYCYLHQAQAGENAIPESERNAQQCLGNAKSTGQQCQNKTTNENGYCYVHKDQAPGYQREEPKTNYTGRCNATTKAGSRCKRTAQSGSRYCWQHQR